MEKPDRTAIRRVLAGDRDAYRVLVDRYYSGAFRLAFRITGNAEEAEEVAQEAFFRAYSKLASFRQDSSFSTWVNRIAMNTALNLIERRTRDVVYNTQVIGDGPPQARDYMQVADAQAGPERLLLNREVSALRESAMAALSPMERTAFMLRHMEEMPIAEIAEALKVPANSAKQAVFRAVSKLRLSLAPLVGSAR